ncbi:NlpC/P60 family protein, partial [Streptomyces macrosporus]|uniref:NlpC/P60 family protein n=1 Tax=Streptomyces macrosporus TaxID=44032 RepID=UPI0031DABDE7
MKHFSKRHRTTAVVLAAVSLALAGGVLPAAAADGSPAKVQEYGSSGQGPVTPLSSADRLTASSIAPTITRSTVIARADSWVGIGLDYDWNGSYQGYRTDCSGYVSMAWNLDRSLTTDTFAGYGVTETISKSELKPGDALLDDDSGAGGHVVLFEKWADEAQSEYWGYEFTPSGVHHRRIPYPYFSGSGPYVPVRNTSVVDDAPSVPSGTVWDRSRSASGTWQSHAVQIDDNGDINAVSAAALPDGTLHVQTLVNGDVWDRTRRADGSWTSATKIDDNGDIDAISAAALPDGTLHVQTLVNGDVWDRTRSASGAWSSATKIDDNGGIKAISSAGLSDGTLHVQTLVNGDVWDRTRSASGAWSSATKIDDNGGITGVSAAGL